MTFATHSTIKYAIIPPCFEVLQKRGFLQHYDNGSFSGKTEKRLNVIGCRANWFDFTAETAKIAVTPNPWSYEHAHYDFSCRPKPIWDAH
jgi:hypothetical protein